MLSLEKKIGDGLKTQHLRLLIFSNVLYLFSWIFISIHTSILGIIQKTDISIHSPQAIFLKDFFNISLRFSTKISGWSSSVIILIIPTLIIVIYIAYCIYDRKKITWKKNLFYIFTLIFSLSIIFLLSFTFIPGICSRTIYSIKLSSEKSIALKHLQNIKIEGDVDAILEKIKNTQKLIYYSDYSIGSGALLATIIDEIGNNKLNFYQSFYIPLYFWKNNIVTNNPIIDKAEIISFNNNIIIDKNIKRESLQRLLLPIGNSYILNSYYKYVSNRLSKLQSFSLVDDDRYSIFVRAKQISNLQEYISKNESGFRANLKIIEEYPSLVQKNIQDEQKFVVDAEKKYNDGCVVTIIYNDCSEFRKTIDKSKIVISENKIIAVDDYNLAKKNNEEISITLVKQRKEMDDILSRTQSELENNKTDYSVGMALDNKNIYIRYFKENPMNNEVMRVVIHELLHIYSMSQEHSNLPESLNEAMTEYFTTKAMGYEKIDMIRASGYPLELQVVMALLERIPQDELEGIYFSQDENKFKVDMKQYFPNTDYKEFMNKLDSIFNSTYRVGGASNSFDKGLIDHKKVIEIRKMLGLSDRLSNVIF